MVSLDDAVLARLEKGGKRYELLVDPTLVDAYRQDPSSVEMEDFLAMDEVFHDARAGERPTEEAIQSVFGTLDINAIVQQVLNKGSIQLTTAQRKHMVEQMRQQIIHHIHTRAVDPKTKSPHPKTRLELALDESRYSVDPFKRLEDQVNDAIKRLKPLLPFPLKRSVWHSRFQESPTGRSSKCSVLTSNARAGWRTDPGRASWNVQLA